MANPLKRFLLFGNKYSTTFGGWNDFEGDFATLPEASLAIQERELWWFNVYDQKEGKTVESWQVTMACPRFFPEQEGQDDTPYR